MVFRLLVRDGFTSYREVMALPTYDAVDARYWGEARFFIGYSDVSIA